MNFPAANSLGITIDWQEVQVGEVLLTRMVDAADQEDQRRWRHLSGYCGRRTMNLQQHQALCIEEEHGFRAGVIWTVDNDHLCIHQMLVHHQDLQALEILYRALLQAHPGVAHWYLEVRRQPANHRFWRQHGWRPDPVAPQAFWQHQMPVGQLVNYEEILVDDTDVALFDDDSEWQQLR